ncbi:MAG: hypothetical protein E6J14_08095 [Chloroflexi bacterium]|nr:MAG: hypothetical protein E6J14_08095 [Chloroflexota bacterium]
MLRELAAGGTDNDTVLDGVPWHRHGHRRRAFVRRSAGSPARLLVRGGIVAYAAASMVVVIVADGGITSEHVMLLIAAAAALTPLARRALWDWLPFLFVAVLFEDVTSISARIAGPPHVAGPAAFEQWLLHGTTATVWLQAHLQGLLVDAVLSPLMVAEYLAHFAVPLVVALWLWKWHRRWFSPYVAGYTLVMGVGFLVYLRFPESPPWLAAQNGVLPHVDRLVVTALQHLGGFGADYAGADPQPSAAMPSLHVAIPALVAGVGMAVPRMRGVAARLLPLYPLTVSFAVVYLGEHYLADAVAGLLLGLAGTVCLLLLQRLAIARERRADSFTARASDPQAA